MAMAQTVGTPPFCFLGKKMFPTSFGKTKSHDFRYKVCELAKHHYVPFPIRNKKETFPFSLIHTNV